MAHEVTGAWRGRPPTCGRSAVRTLREHGAGFVGRDAELARLHRAWDGVQGGRAGLVLVAGEAGVGKTRMMREFVAAVGGVASRVLWGECIDLQQGGLPYAPFRQALRAMNLDAEDSAFANAVRAAGPDLAMLLPSLGEHPATDDEESRRVRLFESLLHLLRRLAEDGPLLFVIEDAHWADDTTLDLVTFLSRNLAGCPALLLLTFRPALVGANPALEEFLASRAGRMVTDQFTLNGFEEHELAGYLAELTGEDPRPPIVADIARRTNGNPLFVQEIVAADGAGGGVPPSLNQMLLGRLSGVDAAVRSVLRVAAVAGHAIPYEVLQEVSGLEADALTAALRQAIDADVLVEDDTIGGYAFRHALLQEALYANLLLHERQALHRHYATALSGHSDEHPLVMGAVATHWDKAGEAERALRAYVQAAAAARRSFSFSDVERYLSRAYALWHEVPDAAQVSGLSHRHLANRLVEAAVLVEDHTFAIAVAREALAMVDAERDPNAVAFQHGQLSFALWYAGLEAEALDESLTAVSLLDAHPSVERARVLGWRAKIEALNGSYTGSRALAEQAMQVATATGAPRAYRVSLATYGSVLARQGELDIGWRYIDDAELLARKRNDADEIMRIFLLRGRVLQAYARWADARDNYAEGISEAAKYGMTRHYVWRFHVLCARMLFQRGEWAEATAEIFQAREHTAGRGASLPPLLIATGEFSAAEEFFARQSNRWRSDGTGLLQVPDGPVELAVWQGHHARARERADEGLALVEHSEELMPRARLCVAALRGEADAVLAAGGEADAESLRRARDLLQRLRAMDAERPVRGDGLGSELAALMATAEAEHARLTGADDTAPWATAAQWWQRLEMPYPAAYARLRQAEALAARGAGPAAHDLLSDALATATGLGAAPLRDAIIAARDAAGPVSETSGDTPREVGPPGLTSREREVAAVLMRGRSNRQIAEELFIAEGTASVHVSRILRKLGVTSRGEAIALLLREQRAEGG
ncbi:MAG TPA: AAA family ATPase [Euzebyales bacterium]|nr:AAA family ATPase [Euzebyales bacterium]